MNDKATVLSVTELNTYIKTLIEQDKNTSFIYVKGEISNFKEHSVTGHLYFSLKDENAVTSAVMFRGNASKLKFAPQDGMKVIVFGRVSLFVKSGQFQMYIDEMLPDGRGALDIAFEQLKEKLLKEGLLDQKYKKPIPKNSLKIGVVTSPTGAAVRDIINITGRRMPLAKILLYPVLVQGDGAAASIEKAINYFSDTGEVDVIIVGRGGGSIEDLWAFNEERIARAVFECKIPVISAVGHETDFTICDYVADLRAPTPSAAAEIAVSDREEIKRQLLNVNKLLYNNTVKLLSFNKETLKRFKNSQALTNPQKYLDDKKLNFDHAVTRFINASNMKNITFRNRLAETVHKLSALSPLAVLERGYSYATDEEGKTVSSIKNINLGSKLNLDVADGRLLCSVLKISEKERI